MNQTGVSVANSTEFFRLDFYCLCTIPTRVSISDPSIRKAYENSKENTTFILPYLSRDTTKIVPEGEW